jgi:hypothetical protein
MLLAAQVFHTNLHNLIQQPNNPSHASCDLARVIPIYLEVVPLGLHFEIDGRDFYCVLKENLNG